MISTLYGFNYTGVTALKNDSLFTWLFSLLILISQCCLMSVAHAQTARVAQVVSTQGTVTAINAQQAVRTLQRRTTLYQGDTVVTGKSAHATLRFSDDSEISLQPQTRYRIDEYHYDKANARKDIDNTSLLVGGMRVITGALSKRSPNNYAVTTPVAVIGVRGTIYTAMLIPKGNCRGLNCDFTLVGHRLRGTVTMTANGKTAILNASTPYAMVDGRNATPVSSKSAPKTRALLVAAPATSLGAANLAGAGTVGGGATGAGIAALGVDATGAGVTLGGNYLYAQQGSADSIFGATYPTPGTFFKAPEDNGSAFNLFSAYSFGSSYVLGNWQRDHDDGRFRTLDGMTINTRLDDPVIENTGVQFSDFDQVSLELGTAVVNNNTTRVDVQVGPQFLDITHHLNTNAAFCGSAARTNLGAGFYISPLCFAEAANNKSEFEGGGLRANVIITRHLDEHFDIFAGIGVGAVFGKLKTTLLSIVPVDYVTTATTEGRETTVPTVNAELGVGYTFQMLTINTGIRSDIAFDAVQMFRTFEPDSALELSNFTQASVFAGASLQLNPALGVIRNLI